MKAPLPTLSGIDRFIFSKGLYEVNPPFALDRCAWCDRNPGLAKAPRRKALTGSSLTPSLPISPNAVRLARKSAGRLPIHNMEKHTPNSSKNINNIVELATEWIARHTYGDFIRDLGGMPTFEKQMLNTTYNGYSGMIKNFEKARKRLGVDKDKLRQALQKMISTVKEQYRDNMVTYLHQATNTNVTLNQVYHLMSEINNEKRLKELLRLYLP